MILLALTACWIPENFDTKITINKDGSYLFVYDGTLTFGLALAAAQQAPSAHVTKLNSERKGTNSGECRDSRESTTKARGDTRSFRKSRQPWSAILFPLPGNEVVCDSSSGGSHRHRHGRPTEPGGHSATQLNRCEDSGNLECVGRERRPGCQAQRRERANIVRFARCLQMANQVSERRSRDCSQARILARAGV